MTRTQNQHAEPQLICMTDQHGRSVALNVRQDGKQPSLVPPGRRVRFKIQAHALAYRVGRVVLRDSKHWHIHDIRVGSRSQLSSVGDSPEEDGFPGEVLSADIAGCLLSFETVQKGMDFTLDVTYRGPEPDGVPLNCVLWCTVASSPPCSRCGGTGFLRFHETPNGLDYDEVPCSCAALPNHD